MSGLADDEEEGGDDGDFFEEGFDAVTLLDQMGHHQQGSSLTEQPFEVLKRAIGAEGPPQAEVCSNKDFFRPNSTVQHAALRPCRHKVSQENLGETYLLLPCLYSVQ